MPSMVKSERPFLRRRARDDGRIARARVRPARARVRAARDRPGAGRRRPARRARRARRRSTTLKRDSTGARSAFARPRRLSSRSSSSRPACRLRARSSLWNQLRTFSRERALARKPLDCTQPVAPRFGDLAGEDFDAIAAAQHVVERHDAAVDLRAAGAMADVGVQRGTRNRSASRPAAGRSLRRAG